jgi:phosphoribosylformylglycinamidine cyclo-ligase
VGVVEKKGLITGGQIAPDDVVIGIQSSGFHSNGFSLVRKVVFEKSGLAIDSPIEELGQTVGEALMTPTIIYTKLVRQVLGHYKVKNVVHGIAHITGGGLLENTERILPPKVDLVFERDAWTVPGVFTWLQQLGEIPDDEMSHVFNMGLGLAIIVNPFYANTVMEIAASLGLKSWLVGKASAGRGTSRWR